MSFAEPERVLETLRITLTWLPTSWPPEVLVNLAGGRWGAFVVSLALTCALGLTIWSAGHGVFVGTFLAGWGRVHEHAPRSRRTGVLERLTPPVPQAMRAIVLKDWLTVLRDLKIAAGLFFFVPYIGFLIFMSVGRPGGAGPMIAVAPVVASSVLGQAFIHEGRAFAILRAAPVSAAEVFFGKLIALLVPIAVALWVLLIVTQVLGSPSGMASFVGWWASTAGLAGSGAISMSAAAVGTDHRREPPQLRPLIGLGSALAIMVFLAPNLALAAWLFGTVRGTLPYPIGHPLVGLVALATTAAVWWGVVLIVRYAIDKLESLELA